MSLIGLLMTLAISSGLLAQQAGYSQTNLVSNAADAARTTDPHPILARAYFWCALAPTLDAIALRKVAGVPILTNSGNRSKEAR
jgi:hypothetical protein